MLSAIKISIASMNQAPSGRTPMKPAISVTECPTLKPVIIQMRRLREVAARARQITNRTWSNPKRM